MKSDKKKFKNAVLPTPCSVISFIFLIFIIIILFIEVFVSCFLRYLLQIDNFTLTFLKKISSD